MYFLGIDAGGTKTEFALGDHANTIATFTAPSVKLGSASDDQARATLASGIREICKLAAITPSQIGACAAGLSGFSIPAIRQLATSELATQLAHRSIHVVGDHVIAHRAAFPDGVGVLTISGTGSICYGRTAHGREMRSGGHGPVISDEGSGNWIGRELLRRLLRAHDVGHDGALLQELVDRYGNGDASELIRKANSGEIIFSQLAPLVVQDGDELSSGILQDAAVELAALASDVAVHLFPSGERVKFALAGSVANLRIIKDAFLDSIMRSRPDSEFVESRLTPAQGALVLAREIIAPET